MRRLEAAARPAAAAKPASAAALRGLGPKPSSRRRPSRDRRARARHCRASRRYGNRSRRARAAAAASSSAVEPLLDLSMHELRAGLVRHLACSPSSSTSRSSLTSIDAVPHACPAPASPSPTMPRRAASSPRSRRSVDWTSSNRLRSSTAPAAELVELLAASNCLRLDAMAPLRQTASLHTSSCAATPPRKCCPPIYPHCRAPPPPARHPRRVAARRRRRPRLAEPTTPAARFRALGHKNALVALKADAPMGGVEAARGGAEAAARRRRRSAGRRVGGPWRHKDDTRPPPAPPSTLRRATTIWATAWAAPTAAAAIALGVVARSSASDLRRRRRRGRRRRRRRLTSSLARVELPEVAVGAGDDAASRREVPW